MGHLAMIAIVVVCTAVFAPQNVVMGQEKSCRAALNDLTKMQMGLLSACTKQLKFKGKEKSKKMNCILRCALIKVEMLDEDGQASATSVHTLITKYMPPSLHERANSTFFPCIEIGLNNKFKSMEEDESCTTYEPFIKCFMSQVQGLCP